MFALLAAGLLALSASSYERLDENRCALMVVAKLAPLSPTQVTRLMFSEAKETLQDTATSKDLRPRVDAIQTVQEAKRLISGYRSMNPTDFAKLDTLSISELKGFVREYLQEYLRVDRFIHRDVTVVTKLGDREMSFRSSCTQSLIGEMLVTSPQLMP